MRLRRPLTVTAASAALLLSTGAPALAHDGAEAEGTLLAAVEEEGTARGGLSHVTNLQYPPKMRGTAVNPQNGTDIEFVTVGATKYAVAGTNFNGMQIVNITDPENPVLTATYDCQISQGDVQVFRQGQRVLATYTQDANISAEGRASACGQQFMLPSGWRGTILVDLTNPAAPVGVSAIPISTGSHNMTVHPSGNFLYNSNSELITDVTPTIELVNITDPANPVRLPDFTYPLNPSSLGANSHDVAFNAAGTRGYSASLSSTLIFNTENPAAPVLIEQIENLRINVEHDVKWLSLPREGLPNRELLLVGDEIAGAAGNGACPGGGITVFDITGDREGNPKDLGTWFINDTSGARETGTGTGSGVGGTARCTAHVFQVYPDQKRLTIGWYQRGARVLDISGLATFDPAVPQAVALGTGVGMTEIGSFFFPDSDTWSFKTNEFEADGSFYGFGNDLSRGFDVYRFNQADAGSEPEPVIPEVPMVAMIGVAAAGLFGATVLRRRRSGSLVA